MRTALWETAPGALAELLNARRPIERADLYTLTLTDGTVYRWSGSDIAIAGNGSTWQLGPGITRNRLKWSVGVAVDTMVVTLTDIRGTTLNGQGLMAFIAAGGLIGARLQVDVAFWAGLGAPAPTGALLWFAGRIAEVHSVTRWEASINVKSDLELLDVMVPRDVYQPGCLNTVYDPACGRSRAAFTVTGAATVGSSQARTVFGHALAQAAGWFDLGVVTFTSGANAGISRTVKQHTSAQLKVLQPLPFPVQAGDTFAVYPGCDKTVGTCMTKFNNVDRFRGHPYIPVPETVI
jgi:uncharacterized phage protein (TIGR02218 family)